MPITSSVTYAILTSRNNDHSPAIHRVHVEINQLHHCRHFFFNPHFSESNDARVSQPRTNTSSPKSLSSVTSTRPSSAARASMYSSAAPGVISEADRTSCPRRVKVARILREDAETSRRNFTNLHAYVSVLRRASGTRTESTPVYPLAPEMDTHPKSPARYPPPQAFPGYVLPRYAYRG